MDLLSPLLVVACVHFAVAICPSASITRQDCGFPGINLDTCVALSCCWDNTTSVYCALPTCDGTAGRCVHGSCVNSACACEDNYIGSRCDIPPVTTVHVVQSCHLDVGFAQTAPDIVNLWFGHHFPMAIAVAAELRQQNGTARLKFMAQSYLVSLYLDCPVGMGLNCPNASAVAEFKQAVLDGAIWWHAFPHNAELETMAPVLVEEGVKLSQSLQVLLGAQVSTTLSQRDVPGMTRSVVPILRKAGVNAINVGCNGASTPPKVPKIFRWLDEPSNTSITAMVHPYGYGGYDLNSVIAVPGCTHALVTDWNGDNAGPYDSATYTQHFQEIQAQFPNATIIASTWDDFTQQLVGLTDNLPVVTGEIGDTWMYGVPSEPRKVAQIRVINSAWQAYADAGLPRDPVYLNATRLVLKAGEHTWGGDVKAHLVDNTDWSNAAFEAARVDPLLSIQFTVLEASWWRQREWSIGFALQALVNGNHSLGNALLDGFSQLQGQAPSPTVLEQYNRVANVSELFDCGSFIIGFDGTTGAITTLVAPGSSNSWAMKSAPLALLNYRTYNATEVEDFIQEYVTSSENWAQHDFGKPGVSAGNPVGVTYLPQLSDMYFKKGASGGGSFLLRSTLDPYAAEMAGAAAVFWTQVDLPAMPGANVNISVSCLNKTATRLPESMFLTFQPPAPLAANVSLHKLGSWVHVGSAGDVVDGGAQKLHFVQDGFVFQTPTASLVVVPVDAGVVCVGEPSGYPEPSTQTADAAAFGVSSVLWGNLWGTNYIMWYPFASSSAEVPTPADPDLLFRYTIAVQ